MIIVIVTNVEGKVPIDSLKRAGTIQTARATSADASFDRIFRQMLDHVTGAAAGKLRLDVLSGFPQVSHMPQPQVSGFNIDGALPNVVLNVGICRFVLGSYVFKRKFIRGYRRSQ